MHRIKAVGEEGLRVEYVPTPSGLVIVLRPAGENCKPVWLELPPESLREVLRLIEVEKAKEDGNERPQVLNYRGWKFLR